MSSNETVVSVAGVRNPAVTMPARFEQARPHLRGAVGVLSLFFLATVFCVVFLVVGDDQARPVALLLTFLSAGVNFILLMAVNMSRHIVWHGIRMRSGEGLWIVGAGFSGAVPLLAGLSFLAACGVSVWSRIAPGVSPLTGPAGKLGGLVVLFAIGVGCIVGAMLKAYRPSGLRIEVDGISARKGLSIHRMKWGELEAASIRVSGKLTRLELHLVDDSVVSIPAIYLGSNPYFVAELLTYYLRHPEERTLLEDPMEALRKPLVLDSPA
ncbi:PH domain-containing protein [Leucobacter sp. NPDC058333]|uniref:PH domain-containing protein n=1 Tax=Leucobacter sp. NPDC058333 TaxID=3346450 RepID=UPI00365AA357